jgi:hypothetical protein
MKKLVLLFAFVGCFTVASNAQCSASAKAAGKACCAHPTAGCDKNAKTNGTASTSDANTAVQVSNIMQVVPAEKVKACCANKAGKSCTKDTKTTSVEVAPTPANGGMQK